MGVETWVLIVLGGFLVFSTTCGLVFSLVLVFSNQELQRCRRCHRYGIALPARFHVPSCPPNHPQIPESPQQRWNSAIHLHHR